MKMKKKKNSLDSLDARLIKEARTYPIEDILRLHGIEVRRKGRYLFALCPFHAETDPSFVVFPDNHYHCFGCGEHGDAIKLLMKLDGLDFPTAVQKLTGQRVVSPSSSRPASSPLPPPKKEIPIEVLTRYTDMCNRILRNSPVAQRYVLQRGLSIATAQKMKLGYAPPGHLWVAINRGFFSKEEALEAHLLARWEHGFYEFFSGRIIIPEIRAGKVIHLSGRLTEGTGPKYLFLPGPKPLYGWDLVKDRVGQAVFITEGLFDWLTLVQWGYPAVCLLGTYLKAAYTNLFSFFNPIFIVLDMDRAGQEAAQRLQKLWANAIVISLPEGVKDVNELAQKPQGREIFAELVKGYEKEI